jgi:hypothetical protein
MLDKKVFSFIEFVNESYYNQNPINEEKTGFIPSKEDIIKVLEIQDKLKANYKSKNKAPKRNIQIWGSLEVFNSLDESKQAKAISDIQKSFEKLNITEKRYNRVLDLLEKNLEEKKWISIVDFDDVGQPFFIIVTKEEIAKEIPAKKEPEKKPEPTKFSIIDPTKSSYFFKDNMYEIKEDNLGESFEDSEYAKQVLDLIDQKIFESFNYYSSSGEIGITMIDISTSCSRYRNKKEGLSWAELAYNRAFIFSRYILASAEMASKKDKEFVEGIRKAIKLGYFGSNGDGTSGPDPDKNEAGERVRKGYYNDKSVFVDTKGDDLTMINVVDIKIGEKASPILGSTPKKVRAKNVENEDMEKIPATPKEYDVFKYIQISMEGIFEGKSMGKGESTTEPEPKIISGNDYSISINFPRNFKGTYTPRKPRSPKPKKTYKFFDIFRINKHVDCPAYG